MDVVFSVGSGSASERVLDSSLSDLIKMESKAKKRTKKNTKQTQSEKCWHS